MKLKGLIDKKYYNFARKHKIKIREFEYCFAEQYPYKILIKFVPALYALEVGRLSMRIAGNALRQAGLLERKR